MMALCICGHWDDKHQECDDNDCPHMGVLGAIHLRCMECNCDNFQIDDDTMRDMKNVAKQLEWDTRNNK